MEGSEVHISSLVVHVQPDSLNDAKSYISRLPGVEIHGESESGKLVVVHESIAESQITDVIEKINNFDQVLNTALVYHQIEMVNPEELDRL